MQVRCDIISGSWPLTRLVRISPLPVDSGDTKCKGVIPFNEFVMGGGQYTCRMASAGRVAHGPSCGWQGRKVK